MPCSNLNLVSKVLKQQINTVKSLKCAALCANMEKVYETDHQNVRPLDGTMKDFLLAFFRKLHFWFLIVLFPSDRSWTAKCIKQGVKNIFET